MRDGLPENPGVGFLPSWAGVLVFAEHPLTCLAAPASHIVRICQGKKILINYNQIMKQLLVHFPTSFGKHKNTHLFKADVRMHMLSAFP